MTVPQGSAAMSLKCGGTRNYHFVANFVLSLAFWKLLNISRSNYRHEKDVLLFLTHIVINHTENGLNLKFTNTEV